MKRFFTATALTSLLLLASTRVSAQTCAGGQAPYCTSNAVSTADEEISNVTLAGNTITLNNSTPPSSCLLCSVFTGLPAPDLTMGNTYTLFATLNYCGSPIWTNSARAWIDYNHNNVFDATEIVMCAPTGSGVRTVSSPFVVPLTALSGTTRLRIVYVETSPCTNISACGTYTWGETEDYTVNVLPPFPPMPSGYCVSTATSSSGSIISLVTLNGDMGHNINNNTAGLCDSYNDFTALPEAWLSRSANYSITVGLGTCDATNNLKRGKVYIDYSRDGDFNDFGEEVACFGTNTTPQNYVINFQVPSNASFGYTRMRVICYEDLTPYCSEFDACTTYPIGATEDYRVALRDIGACLEPLDIVDLDPLHCGDGGIDIFNADPKGGSFSGPGVNQNVGTVNPAFTGPLAIPDNNPAGANANINVAGIPLVNSGYDVWLESVDMNISHTWVGDLTMTLTSPNGVVIDLMNRPGVPETGTFGCSGDNINATVVGGNNARFYRNMDGECLNLPAVSGTFRAHDPDNLDAVNDGSDPNGLWVLNVADGAAADVGTINSVTLNFGWQEATFDPVLAGLGTHEVVYDHTDLFGTSCDVRDTVEVYFPAVEIKIKQGADSICFGDTITLEATIAGAFGGEITLLTTLSGGNGQNGNMFDLDAINDIMILSFDGNQLGTGQSPATWEIYTHPGTYVGTENNAGSWTLVGSASAVPWQNQGTATPIPIAVNVPIAAGARQAFYVTCIAGWNVAYTNGSGAGNQYAQDANVIFYEGIGKAYPFGATFSPRVFNGVIHYAINASDTTSQYLWSTGDTTSSITFVPTTTNDYWVQVTDSNGCVGSDTINIWVNDEIIIDAPNVPICLGDSVVLGGTPTASGGSGLFQYQWSPGTNLSCTTCPNPVADPAFTITYLLEIVDSFNCYVSQSVTVTVNLNPEADAGPPQAVCPGDMTTIGGSPTGTQGTPPYTYSWAPAGSLDNAAAANPNASPTVSTMYTLTLTDANGCTDVDSVMVIVYPEPDPTITSTGPYCENGGTVQLTSVTPGGTWSGTAVSPSGLFDPAAAGPGFHQVIYTVTNAVGCTAADTVSIQVYPAPVAMVTSATDFCDNQGNVFLTATPPGGTWSGNGIVNPSTGEFDPAAAGSGTHAIVYTYTDANGCVDTDTSLVTVHPAPDATVNAAGPFCENAGVQQLTAATPGGTWSGPGTTVTGQFDPAVAGPGVHTVCYTVTDANGCTDSDCEDITVLAAPAAAINAVGPFCANASSVTLVATPAQGTNYWSGPGIIDPINGVFSPSSAGPGTHTITVAKTYANGCVSIATRDITVNPLPDATINPVGPQCADGSPITLTAATAGGIWSGTGITNPSAGTFDPQVAGPGNHTITYTVTDANGCTGSDDIVITVAPAIVITGVVTDASCNDGADGEIDITVNGGTPGFAFIWSNAATTEDIHKLDAGTYSVTVTDNLGCTATATFTVGEPTPITITFVVTNSTTPQFDNGSIDITVSGGTPPYSFIWSNGETTEDVTGLQADTYRVTIVDANGCRYNFDITVNADFGLSIDVADVNDGMSLYPNPTDGLIHFTLDLGVTADIRMTMVDVLGRTVFATTDVMANTYSKDIDMSAWASGQYILHIQVGDVSVWRKVVLTK